MKKNSMFKCAINIISVLILLFSHNSFADIHDKIIRFGSIAMDTPQVMHKRLLPLTQYLSQELQCRVELVVAANMSTAIQNISAGNVHLSYLSPVAYIRSQEKADTRLIVKTITNHLPGFKLNIIVRNDSSIHTVDQLINKRFAFGDPSALLQRAIFSSTGINVKQLKHYAFLDHHDNIIRGVMHRDYDAGIVKDTMAYKWRNKGIRTIYSSNELPPFNITAAPILDKQLYQKIRTAFLKLDINNPAHQEVIRGLDPIYTGFGAVEDNEYNTIRTLIQPFEMNNGKSPLNLK